MTLLWEKKKVLGEESEMEIENNTKSTPTYFIGTNELWYRRDHMEIKAPLEKGLISDWDVVEKLWDHALKVSLRVDPKEHPILLAEPPFNIKANREKITEIMFEKLEIPALFLAKNPVLSAFSTGKSSALVVDSGAGVTSVTPVHDGYALQKSLYKSSLAGNILTNEYLKIIEQKDKLIRPHYMIESKKELRPGQFEVSLKDLSHTTESYRLYKIKEIVQDIKETVCRVSDSPIDDQSSLLIPSISYELPDGNVVDVGTERYKIPELLFNPEPLNKRKEFDEEFLPLHQMIYNSVAKCDADIRRELFSSIVLTGGSTLFPLFPERLHKEIIEKAPPQMYKVKIVATSTPAERKYSVWIGGSILASLGTFQQMWMSKQEYEEHGRSMVERKCP